MSDKGEKIGFGKPTNFEQAFLRLPDRRNPLYNSDEQIEHLTHLAEWWGRIEAYLPKPIAARFVPLSQADMTFMEKISFTRGEVLCTADWARIPEGLDTWNELLPGDDVDGDYVYRYWQICEIQPKKKLRQGLRFISIEMNPIFVAENRGKDEKTESSFEVGIVEEDELKKLIQELSRSG